MILLKSLNSYMYLGIVKIFKSSHYCSHDADDDKDDDDDDDGVDDDADDDSLRCIN